MISCDNYTEGAIATKYLIDCNCQKILYIGSVSTTKKINMDADKRFSAYMDKITERGLSPFSYDMDFSLSYSEKFNVIRALLLKDKYDGVFTDDSSAIATINAAKACGLAIPGHLKVVGFDGADLTLQYAPYLSTIRQPIKSIAQHAVKTLLSKINGLPFDNIINLPVNLHIGCD
ncbi:TPA: substrate-binding domain-containing protein [Klebsiella pneumoniae]